MKKTESGCEYIEFPHGSKVIATRTEHFNHAPDTIAQSPGDMMMVNHDRWEDVPAGTSTKGFTRG